MNQKKKTKLTKLATASKRKDSHDIVELKVDI